MVVEQFKVQSFKAQPRLIWVSQGLFPGCEAGASQEIASPS
jgi:hypothetical protein